MSLSSVSETFKKLDVFNISLLLRKEIIKEAYARASRATQKIIIVLAERGQIARL